MKRFILAFILLNATLVLYAQDTAELVDSRPMNSIYLNFYGDASLFSVNYDRLFLVTPTFFMSIKTGLGFSEEFKFCFGSCQSPKETYTTIPHHITGNLGKGRNFFEFGLGGTIIQGNTTQHYLLYPIVGYRILPLRSGRTNFRVFGQIPFTGLDTEDILFLPLGLSVGVSF